MHKLTVARQTLREYEPAKGPFPSEHLPTLREAARERFAELLEGEIGNL